MKKILLAIAAIGGLGTAPALAADMALKAPPPPMPTWTGWYIGGNIGGIWGNDPGSVATGPTPATAGVPGTPAPAATSIPMASGTPGSVLGGFEAGYNYQIGNYLVGFEGDIEGAGLSMNTTLTAATITAGQNAIPGNSFTQRLLWDGSFRGRAGVIWSNVLLYATGGLALADTRFTDSFQPTIAGGLPFPGGQGSDYAFLVGYTVGGGLEYKWANWIIGVEGRYTSYANGSYSLGSRSTFGGGTAAAPIFAFAPVSAIVGLNTGQVLFKLDYLFQ